MFNRFRSMPATAMAAVLGCALMATATPATAQKKEKPKKEAANKRKAGGQPAAGKKKAKVAAGQRTLDGDVVVVESPKRSPACDAKCEKTGPAVAPRASVPPRQQAPSVSAREVARIIRGKLSEIAYLLDFMEKQEDTDATARRLGL